MRRRQVFARVLTIIGEKRIPGWLKLMRDDCRPHTSAVERFIEEAEKSPELGQRLIAAGERGGAIEAASEMGRILYERGRS